MVFRKAQGAGWTEDDFQLFTATMSKFIRRDHKVFSKYQPSSIGTMKLYFLEHLNEDLPEMGAIEHLQAGLYEVSLKNFKKAHISTSMRHSYAMREPVAKDVSWTYNVL